MFDSKFEKEVIWLTLRHALVADNTLEEVTSDNMTIKRPKIKYLSIHTNINIMIPNILTLSLTPR